CCLCAYASTSAWPELHGRVDAEGVASRQRGTVGSSQLVADLSCGRKTVDECTRLRSVPVLEGFSAAKVLLACLVVSICTRRDRILLHPRAGKTRCSLPRLDCDGILPPGFSATHPSLARCWIG